MLDESNKCKNKFEEIYDNIAEGAKVRSKISWYEDGEKSSKFFLNLEFKLRKNKSGSSRHFSHLTKGLILKNLDLRILTGKKHPKN